MVAQIYNSIAETVNEGQDDYGVLVGHVYTLADQVKEQSGWNVERLVLHFKWVEAVVRTAARIIGGSYLYVVHRLIKVCPVNSCGFFGKVSLSGHTSCRTIYTFIDPDWAQYWLVHLTCTLFVLHCYLKVDAVKFYLITGHFAPILDCCEFGGLSAIFGMIAGASIFANLIKIYIDIH